MKALEAADAAKRLAEKKEIERKMKKEALKLERARLEQENLRQLELQKKRKKEEHKKKEADMAAKKRQREEEDRKEKERKRNRVEESHRHRQEHDEKLRSEKELKFQTKVRCLMLLHFMILSACRFRNDINYWFVCYRIQEQMRGRNVRMKQISIKRMEKLGNLTISGRFQRLNPVLPGFYQVMPEK